MASDWRDSRLKRFEAAAIAGLGYPAMAALGHTLRWRTSGLHHLDAIRAAGHQPVMAFWHGRILAAALYFRDREIVAVTSESFDGEWIARLMRKFGYGAARGSTSRSPVSLTCRTLSPSPRRSRRGSFSSAPRQNPKVTMPEKAWT